MSLPIQQPGKWGASLPIAIDLAAASWGQYLLKNLVRFKQGRTGQSPSWEGHGGDMTAGRAGVPITDKSYWAGRYVLCELTLEREDGSRLVLADAVAAVSRERRIVSTALVGCDGTVKEYINEGDWSVNIVVGVQATDGDQIVDEYPTDGLKELRKYLDEKKSLRVHSAFLDVFGITRLVVKNYSATQTTEQNYQAVSISAVSDEDMEIYSREYGNS